MAAELEGLARAHALSRWLTRATPGRPRQTPTDLGYYWDRLTCTTSDGLRLVGWAVLPPQPRATVVLLHDLRCNRAQTLSRTALLTAAGYRCVAFDHRAHGESDGRRTSFGWHEGRDAAAVLALVRERWPGQPRAAWGMALGAAALCFAAEHTRDLRGLILESLYTDLADALFQPFQAPGCPPRLRQLAGLVAWVTEQRLGLRLAQVRPREHVGRLAPVPVFLATGGEDLHAPCAALAELCRSCRGPHESYLVARAGRQELLEIGGLPYQNALLGFLDRHLFPQRRGTVAGLVA